MILDPSTLKVSENYKLLIGSVIPRPISFITTQNNDGVVNAAPFSFFNVITPNPPLLSVSFVRKPGGEKKDTLVNIEQQKEFVVHIVDETHAEKVNQSSAAYPHGVSEVEQVGFTLIESHSVKVPSIEECKLRLECRLSKVISLGGNEEAPSADLIIGEVICYHIDDSLYNEGKILTKKLDPISRLAGNDYGKIEHIFSIPRPKL